MRPSARPLLFIAIIAGLSPVPAAAATLHPGDIVVIDTNQKQVVRIDPKTLSREQITHWKKDTGHRLHFPWGIAIDADHRILISDMNAHSVFVVDAATGSKTILSGHSYGSGPKFNSLRGIALDGVGGAYVADTRRRGRSTAHSLLHVDLATGARRTISSAAIGKGPELAFPSDLAIEPAGTLLVNMRTLDAVYRVEPATGDRRVISSPDVGKGPSLGSPYGIALLADGDVVVTDRQSAQVARIETDTGNRVILSSAEVGSGPPMKGPFGVAQAADGNLFVADLESANIYHIDIATGDRRLIASADVGTGPVLVMPRNLAIVPGGVAGGSSYFLWMMAALAAFAGIALFTRIARRSGSPSATGTPDNAKRTS